MNKMSEEIAKTVLENRFMTEKRNKIYTALEELNFLWGEDEVKQVIQMWNDEKPLTEIADHFERIDEEVAVLIMDLSMKGKIKRRERGL